MDSHQQNETLYVLVTYKWRGLRRKEQVWVGLMSTCALGKDTEGLVPENSARSHLS